MTSDELTPIVEAHDRQIGKIVTILEGVATKIEAVATKIDQMATTIQAHDRQIGEMTGKLDALIQIVDDWIRSHPPQS